jgi:hypothetical protein
MVRHPSRALLLPHRLKGVSWLFALILKDLARRHAIHVGCVKCWPLADDRAANASSAPTPMTSRNVRAGDARSRDAPRRNM